MGPDERAARERGERGLGLGTGPLGFLGEARARPVLEAAYDAGIRSFDTAPLYGFGQAELYLGRLLRDVDRNSVVLSTKVGRILRRGVDWTDMAFDSPVLLEKFKDRHTDLRPVFDFSYSGVIQSLEESLDRLGVDSVDICYIHEPGPRIGQVMRETVPALRDLVARGLVRQIGVGEEKVGVIEPLIAHADWDQFLIAGSYTLLDQSAQDAVEECFRRSIGVVVGSPLAKGLMAELEFDEGRVIGGEVVTRETVSKAREISRICANHQVPVLAAALQFPLLHPAVSQVLSGPTTLGQLEENIESMTHPISARLWEDLDERGIVTRPACRKERKDDHNHQCGSSI